METLSSHPGESGVTGRDKLQLLVVLLLLVTVVLGSWKCACFYLIAAFFALNLLQSLVPDENQATEGRTR